jgi:acetyltransferase-like isoleucine patch superfamily enzyme
MNSIISKNIRVRYPDHFKVGAGSIVDDFCYFSVRVDIGAGCHVASGCSVAGGLKHQFRLGDFSGISSGVKIWCESNDYANDLVTLLPPGLVFEANPELSGDVQMEAYTGVGANSVIMPNTFIGEGAVVGALSYVPAGSRLEPWWLYAGMPARKLLPRNRDQILRQVDRVREHLSREAKS